MLVINKVWMFLELLNLKEISKSHLINFYVISPVDSNSASKKHLWDKHCQHNLTKLYPNIAIFVKDYCLRVFDHQQRIKQTNIFRKDNKLHGLHIWQEYSIYKKVIVILIKFTKTISIEDLVHTPRGKMTHKNNLEISRDHFSRVPII